MVCIPVELVSMKYEEAGKYHEVLVCGGCKSLYIEDDGCRNYCLECENCGKMTTIDNLDATLLLELDLEICITCASVWMEDAKKKYPTRKQLKLPEHVQIADMGDHKGKKDD